MTDSGDSSCRRFWNVRILVLFFQIRQLANTKQLKTIKDFSVLTIFDQELNHYKLMKSWWSHPEFYFFINKSTQSPSKTTRLVLLGGLSIRSWKSRIMETEIGMFLILKWVKIVKGGHIPYENESIKLENQWIERAGKKEWKYTTSGSILVFYHVDIA